MNALSCFLLLYKMITSTICTMNDNPVFRRAMQRSCSATNPRMDNNADDGDELQSDADAHNRPPSNDGLALF